jgi:ElaB/YqjD/DUF883 family membrane-anchored ribosome-binding protein
MDAGQPTRVTPGVPPGVAADTETVREAGETADGGEQKAEQIKGQAQEKVNQVKEAAPDQVNQAVSSIQEQARQNPLPFAVGGALVVGFLFGRATKRS